ncbi:uncharacterized protein ISCGN_006179 [Ixodes scapularis]
MAGSNGAATTALGGRGPLFTEPSSHTDDYKVALPPIPTGVTVLNSVLLHCDLKGRPYRIEDFRQEPKRCAVLSDIVALGAFQMNHLWMATLRAPEAKQRLLDAKELEVKKLRCVVIDPCCTEVRVRLHWIPFHVPDNAVRMLLEPYGKVGDAGREWRVEGFEGVESTTRVARVTLKSGFTPDDVPHQQRLQGANVLIVIPGRAPGCFWCMRTGHIRRYCRVPKCSVCSRFGHEKETCVKTYADVTGGAVVEELSQHIMDVEEAENAAHGPPAKPPLTGEPKCHTAESNSPAAVSIEKGQEEMTGGSCDVSGVATPIAATQVKHPGAPRDAYRPEAEKTPPGPLESMDETTESVKRGLEENLDDENPPPMKGMTPAPNPWTEKNKKGRYKILPLTPPDGGERRDSR